MEAPRLLLVNGMPGVGKSTLAAKLHEDLGLPLLGKDMFKEWLYDQLGLPAADITKLLGRTASQLCETVAENFLADGRSIIIENAFHAPVARPIWSGILERTGAACLEIHCSVEQAENERRFMGRITDGTRHAVHTDVDTSLLTNPEIIKLYEPLGLRRVVETDMTQFGDAEYQDLLQTVREEFAHD